MDFSDETVVVAGGANGVGRATATRMASLGANGVA
jgi:NAD(P)-dependent dehydrogenase (short-subunit alcohol dehydrogenase family)